MLSVTKDQRHATVVQYSRVNNATVIFLFTAVPLQADRRMNRDLLMLSPTQDQRLLWQSGTQTMKMVQHDTCVT